MRWWLILTAWLLAAANAQDPAIRALVSELAAARTPAGRDALLARDPKLVTPELARALIDRGEEQRLKGDYAPSLEAYSLAQSVAERAGDRFLVARALYGTGMLRYLQSDFEQALELHRKGLAIREALGDRAGIAAVLNQIGVLYHNLGEFELSLE